jgi:hypothetical protein
MRMVLAAVALIVAIPAAQAADDPFLSRLVGDWIGRGLMRTGPTADPERVYCKITNRLSEDGGSLQQKGRCSLASNSGPIDGTIAAVGSGLYGGALNSLASKGPATIAGSGNGSRLELNADFIDTFDGKPARSIIVLELTAEGYRLTSTRADPGGVEPWQASEIVFTAK